jgi:hypothetical protein
MVSYKTAHKLLHPIPRELQSVLPLVLPPNIGNLRSFMLTLWSSSLKWPPLVRLSRPLNQEAAPNARPATQPRVRKGCSEKLTRMSKKIFSNDEMVNFGLILGGDAVTLFRVSRIEVREGKM